MSEQMKQSAEFSKPIYIGQWRVYDIGATTLKDLVKSNIINQHTNNPEVLIKKPDALVVDTNKEIILYVESKDDGALNSEKQIQDAISQEFDISKEVRAKIYAVRDSVKTIWMNPLTGNRIIDEHGNELQTNIHPSTNPKETEKLLKRILSSISEDNDQILKTKYLNPTDLASKIHQKLWITKNVSPSTALYTFVELFLFKYLSDLGVLKGMYSFEHLRSLYKDNSNVDVLNTYLSDGGPRAKMKELFPKNYDGTGIINGNVFHEDDGDAKIFRAILDEFKNYENENGKFINISKDFKSQLFESFLKQDSDSKNMGQFFTPLKIVDNMVRMVDIKPGMNICDPACGVGKFLLEAIGSRISELYTYDDKNNLKSNISLTGYDKYSEDNGDKTIILAKANALIYFSKMISENPSPEFSKEISDKILNKCFELKRSTLGTLDKIEENTYDLILANPPYVVNGSAEMRKLTNDYHWGGLGIESMFLEWIIRSAKPGGIINVIIPDGILSNITNKLLKSKIKEQCYINSIISLPVKAFFNTPKKTYILTLQKKVKNADGTYPLQTKPVFTYVCSSIGETLDTYRFDTPDDNDLKDAVDNYNLWRNSEPNIIQDVIEKRAMGRFKAIEIDKFNSNDSWIIENWWSETEKIAIGLKKETKKKTVDEFIDLISDTEDFLEGIKGELALLQSDNSKSIDKLNKYTIKEYPLFKIFKPRQGNAIYTKKNINNNKWKGNIPVISSNTDNNGILDYIDLKYVKENDYIKVPCLTWSVDGYAGKLFVRNTEDNPIGFVANNHCGILYPIIDVQKLYLPYITIVLQAQFYNKVKNSANQKLGNNQMVDITIPLPLDDKGDIDLDVQIEIANKHRVAEKLKAELLKKTKELVDTEINFM